MYSIAATRGRKCSISKEDYAAFLDLVEEAGERLPLRVLAWRLIPPTISIWCCGRTATGI